MWCPLIDTNKQNGSFHIVRNSHNFLDNRRGSYIPMPYEKIMDFIEENFLTELPLQAGNALFFDQRLWHASPPNLTQMPRVSVGMVLIPKETTLIHYYAASSENGTLHVDSYEGDDEFLLRFGFGSTPDDLKHTGSFSLEKNFLTENDFQKIYNQWNNP